MSDNSIFMRVDEVAKVLDVSESYAYKIIRNLSKKEKLLFRVELIANIFTKELTAQIKQKEDKNACI